MVNILRIYFISRKSLGVINDKLVNCISSSDIFETLDLDLLNYT